MWLAEPGADPLEGWPPIARGIICLVIIAAFGMLVLYGRSDD